MAQVTPPADDAAPTKPRTPKASVDAGAGAAKAPATKTPSAKAPAAKTPAAKAPAAKAPAVKAAPAPAAAPATPAIPTPPTAPTATLPAIPTPPAEGSAPAYATAPATRRRIWPWVLGGAVLLLILLIVGVSVLVGSVLNAVSGASQPSTTVLAFDQSYKDVDCTLFKSTTTEDFRAGYFDSAFTCEQWEPIATGLRDNGVYHYTVVVKETKISGDSAEVTTTEQDTTPGDEQTYQYDYTLVKANGGWLIDGITDIG